jgi:adenylate kinase
MNGVVLDGFPRTLVQAQTLDAELQHFNRKIDLVIYLKVSREELLQRLAGRVFCQAHQHVYHVKYRPPKVAGICDQDGSKLYQRPDDAGEAMRRRLVIYFNQTVQVLEHYSQQQKLREINGNQNIDQVHAALLGEINLYSSSASKG